MGWRRIPAELERADEHDRRQPLHAAAGIAVGIEPPVFLHEERLGASIVDIVLVSRDGCKLRWRSSRDLIVV